MRFKVRYLAADGKLEMSFVDAVSEVEARRLVGSSGVGVISVDAEVSSIKFWQRSAPKFDLLVFNQQLHSLLDAGQTVVDSIEILGRNDVRGRHRLIYDTILDGLKRGQQLSAAMEAMPSVFPALYIAMLRASETTGSLRAAIHRFMRYQKQVDEIRSKLISAAVYPGVLMGVGALVTAFLMLFVVPRFAEVFEDVRHGGLAQGFIRTWGGFVQHHTAIAWLGTLFVIVGFAATILHPAPRLFLMAHILRIPVVGEKLWLLQLARLYRTLGMLLKCGVTLVPAIRMTRDSLAENMRSGMENAIVEVSQGHSVSAVFKRHQLSTEVADRLLLAGESSGNLDEMMERIADFYDQQVTSMIDTIGRLIEPALMIGIGLVIGAIIMMLYSPIFELTNVV